MLHYLPLTSRELAQPKPPPRPCSPVDSGDPAGEGDAEELAEEVRDEVALASLILARDEGAAPTRLIVSADLPAVGARLTSWEQIDSIYADDVSGRDLVVRLFSADSQAEADALLELLFEESLMWYDASERDGLVAAFGEPIHEV